MPSQLHRVVHGPQDGMPLLLLHPLGSNIAFWDECVAIWTKQHRVIACDLRGAGQSSVPDRPWTLMDHVRDVIALRQGLAPKPWVVIGCAIGSLIAAAYAHADRQHVRGLVLCDTTPCLGEDSRTRTLARVEEVRHSGIEALLPKVADMAFDGLPHDARYRRYIEMYRSNSAEGYAATALGMVGTDISASLRAITCPSLVVVGGQDKLLPPGLSREVHALLSGSDFVQIDEAAHFPPFQAPKRFASIVNEFLEQRVLPAKPPN